MRLTVSLTHNAGNSHDSSMEPNTGVTKQSTRTTSDTERGSEGVGREFQLEELISHSERSGRAVRLPTRFR